MRQKKQFIHKKIKESSLNKHSGIVKPSRKIPLFMAVTKNKSRVRYSQRTYVLPLTNLVGALALELLQFFHNVAPINS